MNRTWRLIDSGPCSASHNMAMDEAIATCVRRDGLPPALRFYGWDRPSVSLGHFQKTSDVDVRYCRSEGIPIVRRPTGGRAILHDDEFTYSFSAGTVEGLFSTGLLDSYKKISSAFYLAFRKIGVPAESKTQRERGKVLAGSPLCFQSSSYGEILVGNRKIVGSAQKRWEDGLLQQGSIPYSYEGTRIRGVFGEDRYAAFRDYRLGLRDILPGLDDTKFRKIIAASFEEVFDISLLQALPSQEESALALELQQKKYLLPGWNFGE